LQHLLREPPEPAVHLHRPPHRKLNIDCHGNPKVRAKTTNLLSRLDFFQLFSGPRPAGPVTVVDLIPFSYELDVLEVRLFELEQVVDVFVIAESTVSFKKWRKPLLLGSVLSTSRFERFREKILYV
jgi:hypothetical protein